jgi:hypothetical protein
MIEKNKRCSYATGSDCIFFRNGFCMEKDLSACGGPKEKEDIKEAAQCYNCLCMTCEDPNCGHCNICSELPKASRNIRKCEQYKTSETKSEPEKTTFYTGAVRSSKKGKGRFDLLPFYAIESIAKLMEEGAEEYGERNWEKGIDYQSYIDSALRHISQFMMGLTDEDHLQHATWNLLCCLDTRIRMEKEENENEYCYCYRKEQTTES